MSSQSVFWICVARALNGGLCVGTFVSSQDPWQYSACVLDNVPCNLTILQ